MPRNNPKISWPTTAMYDDEPDDYRWQGKGIRVEAIDFVLELTALRLEIDNSAQKLKFNVDWAIDLPLEERRWGNLLLHMSAGAVIAQGVDVDGNGGEFSVQKPKIVAFTYDHRLETSYKVDDVSHTLEFWYSKGDLEDHGYSSSDYENGQYQNSEAYARHEYKLYLEKLSSEYSRIDYDRLREVAQWATKQVVLRIPSIDVSWVVEHSRDSQNDNEEHGHTFDDCGIEPF
jgi:hypothetical protein